MNRKDPIMVAVALLLGAGVIPALPGASGRATLPSTTAQSSAKPPNGAKT